MDENKIFKDLNDWHNNTKEMFDNLTNFVDASKKDLTPDEVKMIDDEMNKLDLTEFNAEMKKIEQKLSDQFAKMNK